MIVSARSFIYPVAGALLLLGACSQQNAEDLLTAARSNLEKKETKAAIIQLKLAIDKNTNLSEARFLLGKSLLESGDATSASVELQKAFDLGHAPEQVIPLLAKSWLASQKPQKVIEEFSNTTLGSPEANAELKVLLASAHASKADKKNAEAAIAQANAFVPDFSAALLLQAKLALDAQEFEAAKALNGRLLSKTPNDPAAWVQKGEILVSEDNRSAAGGAAFRKALELDPGHTLARSGLITLLLREGDVKAAKEETAQLQKLLPNHPQVFAFLAQIAGAEGEPKKALELIERALKNSPDNAQLLQLAGGIQLSNHALLAAERSFSKALTLQPDLTAARRQLAVTWLRMGQPALAIKSLEPLILKGDANPSTYALAGEANLQLGQHERSQTGFANAVKLDPKNSVYRTHLAMAKLRSNGVKETANELARISASEPTIMPDLTLVSLLLANREFDDALKAIDTIEKKAPKQATGANLRGQVYVMKNQEELARASFMKALAIDPVFVPAAASLASLDLIAGNTVAARKNFDNILKTDPNNLKAMVAVAKLRIMEGAPKQEVSDLLAKAAKANPSSAAPRLMLIDHLLEQRDFKDALTIAQAAVTDIPNNADLVDALGRTQANSDNREQSIATFNKLAQLEPLGTRAHIRLAGLNLAGGNSKAAAQSLQKALALATNPLPIQQTLLDIANAEDRKEDALAIARLVQTQRPGAAIGFDMEAAIEVKAKNKAKAAEIYQRALKSHPSSEFAQKLHAAQLSAAQIDAANATANTWLKGKPNDAEFIAYLGDIAMLEGKLPEAEKHFQSLVKLQPGNVGALNNLAFVLAKQKKAGAVTFAEQALKLQPNTPGLMDTLATALAAAGRSKQALEIQKQACALAPEDYVLKLNLANLQIQEGETAAAKATLQALAGLGDKFPLQKEVSRLADTLR